MRDVSKRKLLVGHIDIARKADFIGKTKGGSAVENWLEAERLILGKNKKEL